MTDAPHFLIVDNLVAGYRPGLPIVNDLSVHVDAGEIVTVIGPNGAGKSTLIKAIAGLVIIESGTIHLNGRDITGTVPHNISDFGIAYVPQTSNIFATLSVSENLALAARRCKSDPSGRIAAMIALFPILGERLRIRAGGLSGGQRQVLAIAMALIAEPRLILMDEPTAGLSPKAAEDVVSVIRAIAAKGVAILLVEQNARLALGNSNRAYILADGRNQLDGPARNLLDDPVVGEIYLGGKRRGAA